MPRHIGYDRFPNIRVIIKVDPDHIRIHPLSNPDMLVDQDLSLLRIIIGDIHGILLPGLIVMLCAMQPQRSSYLIPGSTSRQRLNSNFRNISSFMSHITSYLQW